MSEYIRWKDETAKAARHLGWIVVETDGVSDYQGWGVHLLKRVDPDAVSVAADARLEGRDDVAEMIEAKETIGWAVLAWSYGSCSGCDAYEGSLSWDAEDEDYAALFGELIEACSNEDAARMKFSERKGW